LGWANENGRWVHSAVSQDTFNYYSAIRSLYEAGGLDPDFALIDQNVGWEKFASGRAGAISASGAPAEWVKGAQSWAAQNPGVPFADVTGIVPSRPDENGVRWRYVGGSFWSEMYINANVDDAKLDAILGLYEYLLSDEFRTIKNHGIEGVDYQMDSDGTIASLLGTKDDGTAVTPADKYPFLRSMATWATWAGEDQYYSEATPIGIREESMEALMWEIENAEPAPVYWELEAAAATLPTFAQMGIDVAADRVNFVLSNKSPQQAWQDIIARYNAMGYQAFEDEMNEYAASLGM
jgi:putative aldouronate transport system substrate-binding protein